jgi:hypothetical protein
VTRSTPSRDNSRSKATQGNTRQITFTPNNVSRRTTCAESIRHGANVPAAPEPSADRHPKRRRFRFACRDRTVACRSLALECAPRVSRDRCRRCTGPTCRGAVAGVPAPSAHRTNPAVAGGMQCGTPEHRRGPERSPAEAPCPRPLCRDGCPSRPVRSLLAAAPAAAQASRRTGSIPAGWDLTAAHRSSSPTKGAL